MSFFSQGALKWFPVSTFILEEHVNQMVMDIGVRLDFSRGSGHHKLYPL